MKRVVVPIEFCNDCRYSVFATGIQKSVLICEKTRRTLVAFPSAYEAPAVEVPEDCPLPDFKE